MLHFAGTAEAGAPALDAGELIRGEDVPDVADAATGLVGVPACGAVRDRSTLLRRTTPSLRLGEGVVRQALFYGDASPSDNSAYPVVHQVVRLAGGAFCGSSAPTDRAVLESGVQAVRSSLVLTDSTSLVSIVHQLGSVAKALSLGHATAPRPAGVLSSIHCVVVLAYEAFCGVRTFAE